MASISLGLAIDQAQRRGPADLRITVTPGEVIPLSAQTGYLTVWVRNPRAYRGNYGVQTDALVDGPVNLLPPQIVQDPQTDALTLILQGLWARDENASMPVFSYQWQRGGVDIPGATSVQYTPVSADLGQTLHLIETVTDNRGARSAPTNGVPVAALPDLFEVRFEPGAFARLVENDGRGFVLDDPTDVHDGSYAVDPAALAAGPVALTAPVLGGPGEAGATLAITPALFAYDAGLGPVSLSYASSGAGTVDTSDPDAPRLLVDDADAETTLVVTVTATQGGVPVAQVTNGVPVAALPDLFEVRFEPGAFARLVENDGRGFVLDDPTDVHDGSYAVDPAALAAGPVALTAPVLGGPGEAGATLAITPALFAYDAGLGPVSLSYASSGAGTVDTSDPDAPRLLVDDADAETTLVVTVTATQGGVPVAQVTNGVPVAALPDLFEVRFEPGAFARLVENDGRGFVLDDPTDVHDGSYAVDPAALAAGPVALTAPVLGGPGEAGATLAITPALFAYDAGLGPVSLSYASSGAGTVDTSDPDAPRLLVDDADAETTLVVTVTATQGGVPVAQVTNGVPVAALPDLFEVSLEADGTLLVRENDGRSFIVDDTADSYDGSYSIDPAALSSGPVALVPTRLNGLGEAGSILSITPALFAYDPDIGGLSIAYTTTGTNAVDASNPSAPTLLIDAADAASTITVTAIATQGPVSSPSQSNGVSVASLPVASSLTATRLPALSDGTNTSTPTLGALDLSAFPAGSRLVLVYGTNSNLTPTITVSGNPAGASIADTGSGRAGGRIWVFEYVLAGSEGASAVVSVSGGASNNAHILEAVVVEGGARDGVDTTFISGVVSGSGTVTPTGASNMVLAIAMGRQSFFGGHAWTNAAQVGSVYTGVGRSSAVALVEDVSVAARTITFTPDSTGNGNDEAALAVLSYTAV